MTRNQQERAAMAAKILKAKSPLRKTLPGPGISFLEFAANSITRLLPHVVVSAWTEGSWQEPGATWNSNKRQEVCVVISVGTSGAKESRSLTALMTRRNAGRFAVTTHKTIDEREHDICGQIAARASDILKRRSLLRDAASILAIEESFDEYVIASHIQSFNGSNLSVAAILRAFHTLSEQTYENRALTFGCIVERSKSPQTLATDADADFPFPLLDAKKFRALSDGFRTSYVVSAEGTLVDFVDLKSRKSTSNPKGKYYPEWSELMAKGSHGKRFGIALSRQGDLLVFDGGVLRFTYRYGRWQYWNHGHLVSLLRDQARAQHVKPKLIGRVVGAIYLAALDVSFRRSGALFVILGNRQNLREIVRQGDALLDPGRSKVDSRFDRALFEKTIQSLPRPVTVELASVDGAIVLENSGRILAYGAVLEPRRRGRLHGTEGARTKAAVGASNYGLTIKVSSDGEISFYQHGASFLKM